MSHRRKAIAILIVTAGAALAPAACSLFVDTGGLAGGAGGADATDGAESADGGETGASDARGDESAAVTCAAGPHEFCDDFDDGVVGERWTNVNTFGATLTLTDAAATSPPRSLGVELGAPDGGARRYAYLLRRFDTKNVSRVVIELDLRADTFDSTMFLTPLRLRFTGASLDESFHAVGIAASRDKALAFERVEHLDGTFSESDKDFGAPLAGNRFSHIRLTVTLGSTPSYLVSLDGVEVASNQMTVLSHDTVWLEVGLDFVYEPAGPIRFFVDNVTLDRTF